MYYIRWETDPFYFLSEVVILSNLYTFGKCQRWYNSAEARMLVVVAQNMAEGVELSMINFWSIATEPNYYLSRVLTLSPRVPVKCRHYTTGLPPGQFYSTIPCWWLLSADS